VFVYSNANAEHSGKWQEYSLGRRDGLRGGFRTGGWGDGAGSVCALKHVCGCKRKNGQVRVREGEEVRCAVSGSTARSQCIIHELRWG
jgi:hypothetical protein